MFLIQAEWKIDSITASYAASALTIEMSSHFLLRLMPGSSGKPHYALQYLIDRQAEAWRNHSNSYCHQTLVGEGKLRMRLPSC